MPGIEPQLIQDLENQIEEFKKLIETAGSEGRNKLKSIKIDEAYKEIPKTNEGKFDPEAWSKLPEDKQHELHNQLSQVCDSLRSAASLEGPRDPQHIMYDAYASNRAIIGLTLFSFGLLILLLAVIVCYWDRATGTDLALRTKEATAALVELDAAKEKAEKAKAAATDGKLTEETNKLIEAEKAKQDEAGKKAFAAIQAIRKGGATEVSVLVMVMLLGALGGVLHLVGSLVKFIGNRRFKRSWVFYYLAMPLTGAGLAPIVYLLLRIGIINPSGVSADASSLANLNLMAIYAFSILSGMFSRVATDKLGEVFGNFFRTASPPSKDALGPQKPPGDAASGAGKSS